MSAVQQYIDEKYPWPQYQRICCVPHEAAEFKRSPKFIEAIAEVREDIYGRPYDGFVIIWQSPCA